MAYVISEECIACGRCFNHCPLHCIEPQKYQYQINREKCVECGMCASLCPISAIQKEK